jgi:hypothetical protein
MFYFLIDGLLYMSYIVSACVRVWRLELAVDTRATGLDEFIFYFLFLFFFSIY